MFHHVCKYDDTFAILHKFMQMLVRVETLALIKFKAESSV